MNTNYTLIFFAFILLFSNSAFAYRLYSSSYEQNQEGNPTSKLIMIVPTEGDFNGPQYVPPTLYKMPDRKLLFCLFFFLSN